MNIVICGAGEVGRHAAEVLNAKGHHITIVDREDRVLRAVEESVDVRTLAGDCTDAAVLADAGAVDADLFLATTNVDEVNLLAAAVGRALGSKKVVARVHHSRFFERADFSYERALGIDELICPEFATAQAIAQTLRNPGAMAIENFARGQIEMQQIPVSRHAEVIGKALSELPLPRGTRIAAIGRMEAAFIPEAGTRIEPGDSVIMVGDPAHFPVARRFFHDDKHGRRRVVIMGGPPLSVWLCRALKNRNFAIRLFEVDRERAEHLAEKLDWVTVIHGDPTDRDLFDEERIGDADAFVALAHDEENILGCVLAKTHGVGQAIAVIERSKYLRLLTQVGVDKPFSPRLVAVREIERLLDDRPLSRLASLAEGFIDVYRVRVNESADVIGKPLSEVKLSPNWVLAAIQRDGTVHVPGARDHIEAGDTLIVIGRHGKDAALRKLFKV